MAVALIGMNKKKRAWGDDEQKLLDLMISYASAHHTPTLDLLGASHSSPQLHLELGPEQPIPIGWEKRLDLKSGRVYFINWNTGMSTLDDPRQAMHDYVHPAEESGADLKLELCLKNGLENEEEERGRPECLLLLSSNPNSRQERVEGSESDDLVMLTGCKRCLMYVIISPSHPKCPKCGSNVSSNFLTSKKRRVQLHHPSLQPLPSINTVLN